MTKNMTEGSPMKLILGFSIPMLFGMLFQQFYNLVDTMIVGKHWGLMRWQVSVQQAVSTL